MNTRRKRPFAQALTTAVLVLSVPEVLAVQGMPVNDWVIERANVTTTPSVTEFVTGQWVQRLPRKDRTLLEVRGILKVDGDGFFGPLNLSDVKLLSGASGVATDAELVAVGVGAVQCRYLQTQIAAGTPTDIKLSGGRELTLERKSVDGAVFLTTRAPILDLCMAFEFPGTPPAALLLSIAKRPISMTVRTTEPTSTADRQSDGRALTVLDQPPDSTAAPAKWRQMITSPLLWTAAGLTTAALAGVLVIFRLRRRWMADRGSSAPGSALDIPRVGPSHQPTTLTPVGPDAGPGRQHFQGALAALRLGEWTQANELFSKAIEAGLTPTYEAGAWSLRGDAMLNCDDLMGAANCFLRSLSCPAVTTESVMLSAGHLAAIYRELGFRRDASKMDKVKLLASPFGSDLGPQRLELIARLTSKFRHKRRARMLARINPFA